MGWVEDPYFHYFSPNLGVSQKSWDKSLASKTCSRQVVQGSATPHCLESSGECEPPGRQTRHSHLPHPFLGCATASPSVLCPGKCLTQLLLGGCECASQLIYMGYEPSEWSRLPRVPGRRKQTNTGAIYVNQHFHWEVSL